VTQQAPAPSNAAAAGNGPTGGLLIIPLAVASRILGSVLQFALTVYIGRAFAQEDAGIYFIAIGWSYVIAAAVGLGLPWHTLILVSGSLKAGKPERAASELRRALFIAVGAVLILAAVVAAVLLAVRLATGHLPHSAGAAGLLAALGGVLAIQRISVEAVKATGRPSVGLLLDRSSIPTATLVALIATAVLGVPHTTAVLVAALAVAFTFSAGLSATHALRLLPRSGAPPAPLDRSHLGSQFLIQFSDELFVRLPLVVMPFFLSLAAAGGFGVAFTLTSVAGTVIYALYAHYGPVFAGLNAVHDHSALRRTYHRSQGAAAAVTLPLFAAFWLFGELALRLYGEAYVEYLAVLRILAAGAFLPWVLGLANFFLSVCKHDRLSIAATGAAVVVFGVGAAALAPRHGAIGLAASFAAASAVRSAISFVAAMYGLYRAREW
jgi:O-antigen/teichoic acid export membrane protein